MIPARPDPTIRRRTGCAVCGRPLTFHQQCSGRICDDWRCRWTRLDRDMEAHRREAADALGVIHPESYPLLVVPHRPSAIATLPARRRRAHIEFLDTLLTAAAQKVGPGRAPDPAAAEPAPWPPLDLAAAVCAVCAGACCHRGGDNAFLDEDAVMRILEDHHDPQPRRLLDAYTGCLPERSFEGSCVYHTLGGCALPRRLRAAICNRYRCRGLRQACAWAGNNIAARAYVAVREDNRIRRSAFVHPPDIRHYPHPAAGSCDGESPQPVRAAGGIEERGWAYAS